MDAKRTFLKDEGIALWEAILISVSLILLPKNRLYGIVMALVQFFASVFVLYRYHKDKKNRECQLAKLSFLSCFLSGIDSGSPCQKSYDNACRFLIGYQEVPGFEEALSAPERLDLGTYQEYFSYAIAKEKENEVHLHDFRLLCEQMEKQLSAKEEERKHQRQEGKRNSVFLLLLFALSVALFSLYPMLKEMTDTLVFNTLGLLSLALIYPGVYLLQTTMGEKANE